MWIERIICTRGKGTSTVYTLLKRCQNTWTLSQPSNGNGLSPSQCSAEISHPVLFFGIWYPTDSLTSYYSHNLLYLGNELAQIFPISNMVTLLHWGVSTSYVYWIFIPFVLSTESMFKDSEMSRRSHDCKTLMNLSYSRGKNISSLDIKLIIGLHCFNFKDFYDLQLRCSLVITSVIYNHI